MASRIRNLIIALAALTLLPCFTFGREKDAPLRELEFYVASGTRIRNVRFGVFAETGEIVGSRPTGFKTSGRSLRYQYKGPDPLVFFEEKDAPTPDNPEAVRRTPVGRVHLPPDVDEVLFFFTPNRDDPEKGLKYSVTGIDIRDHKVPAGNFTIFNTLSIPFMGAVGKSESRKSGRALTVKPGINTPVDIYPRAEVLLALESESEGLMRVYEDTIHCDRNERVLLILFPPRFPGSLDVGGKLITLPVRPGEDADGTEAEAPPSS